jgi:predicted nucleic acid-binding protein
VIVDTSVWIEFLRPGDSVAGSELEARIGAGGRIVVPEQVLLELLSGPTDEVLAARRRRMLESFEIVATEPMSDALRAAALQRECRRGGETVRNLGDCMIAAVALRLGVAVMHRNHDFEVLARHTALSTVPLG